MPRIYKRKFDWDEAARLRAEGLSYEQIARQLGVSNMAVYRVLNEAFNKRQMARISEWQRGGTCPECGGPATRNRSVQLRCRKCWAKAMATSVRDDALLCFQCREWKQDHAFPRNHTKTNAHRRFRHALCRACGTIARRDYRNRNRERERAYWRARYHAKKKTAA